MGGFSHLSFSHCKLSLSQTDNTNLFNKLYMFIKKNYIMFCKLCFIVGPILCISLYVVVGNNKLVLVGPTNTTIYYIFRFRCCL